MPPTSHRKSAIKITPSPTSPIYQPSTVKTPFRFAIRYFASKIARPELLLCICTFGTAEIAGTTQLTANSAPIIKFSRTSYASNVSPMLTCWYKLTPVSKYVRLDITTIREADNAQHAIACATPVWILETVLPVR